MTIALDTIHAQRAALAARQQQAIQQYTALEQQLALLQRNIDGMTGGLQELDRLLESPEAGLQLLLAAPPAP